MEKTNNEKNELPDKTLLQQYNKLIKVPISIQKNQNQKVLNIYQILI